MELNGMGMGIAVGVGITSSPPPVSSNSVNPKKKRRTNTNIAQVAQRTTTIQDFVPPPLSGFGDTVVASNPFDDTPQSGLNSALLNGPQQIHPHHPHHLGNSQMRGINPLTAANLNSMIPHMSNVNSMNNSVINNHMNHMGNLSNANHSSINMNSMNSMRSNIPQGSINSMNNHMNINHLISSPSINNQINGLNHNLGSPMGGQIVSTINNLSPNPMVNNTLGMSSMNTSNTVLSHNISQSHPNHLNNLRTVINRPNISMTNMNSTVPNTMLSTNQMNNLNMIRSQVTNIQNVNVSQRNQIVHIGNPLSNLSHNLSIKSPSQGINIGNTLSHGIQGSPLLGPKPIPESTGKVYPPDQPMVFNHQNPNAPPISPCGVCHKEVHANDQAILCESGCNFWFHRRCTGLSEIAYDLLMHEVCAEWACDRCIQSKNVSLVKFKP